MELYFEKGQQEKKMVEITALLMWQYCLSSLPKKEIQVFDYFDLIYLFDLIMLKVFQTPSMVSTSLSGKMSETNEMNKLEERTVKLKSRAWACKIETLQKDCQSNVKNIKKVSHMKLKNS